MKCSRHQCRRTASCSFAHGARSTTLRNSTALFVLAALAASDQLFAIGEQARVDARDQRPFRAASELVTTAVTVRDNEGRLVTTLNQSDFIVEEDGVVQPITQFTKERVPVSLSLTLDISDSMRGQRIADARSALAHFLDKLLAIEDEASLLGFNHEARLFCAWTLDKGGMRARLDEIKPSGGTAMYDAV